jgi:hypothetical protein
MVVVVTRTMAPPIFIPTAVGGAVPTALAAGVLTDVLTPRLSILRLAVPLPSPLLLTPLLDLLVLVLPLLLAVPLPSLLVPALPLRLGLLLLELGLALLLSFIWLLGQYEGSHYQGQRKGGNQEYPQCPHHMPLRAWPVRRSPVCAHLYFYCTTSLKP